MGAKWRGAGEPERTRLLRVRTRVLNDTRKRDLGRLIANVLLVPRALFKDHHSLIIAIGFAWHFFYGDVMTQVMLENTDITFSF